MGLYTKEHYKNKAEFAQDQIKALQQINAEDLTETEQISLELLKFILQEDVD